MCPVPCIGRPRLSATGGRGWRGDDGSGPAVDASARRVDDASMEREGVIQRWREAERELVIGWCGAAAIERPAAALRELVAKQRASEGGDYELSLTGSVRVSQILVLALCERYGLRAYQRKGQRRSTFIVQGPKTFVEKVFMPILDRGLPAVVAGIDAWLHVVVEACILDDVPEDVASSGGDA
jgi:hypothetical protein